jgi:hypothetical protein
LIALTVAALAWALQTWKGHNGDHAYYTAMALQYGGTSYDSSLAQVAAYFDHPPWAHTLDLGFLNPSVAPLIYPRVLYPLLAAVPMKLFGISAIYLPGLAAGVTTTVSLACLVLRRHRHPVAVVAVVILLSTRLFTEYGFGIYVDALVLTGIALLLMVLPWDGHSSWFHVLTASSIAVLMMSARQVPLIPLSMVGGGWLWAAVADRKVRNPWWPFVLGVVPTTLAAWYAQNQWAPYDPLLFLAKTHGVGSRSELLRRMPGWAWDGLQAAGHSVWGFDPTTLLLTALALIGLWRARSRPLAGVALGLFASCVVTLGLNNLGHIRYLSPLFPVMCLLAADTLRSGWNRVVPEPAHGPAPPLPRRLTGALAMSSTAAVLIVVLGTVMVNQRASIQEAHTAEVSRNDLASWPLTVDWGEVLCAGDNRQVWFRAPDGRLYAANGTAMASSFSTPRISSLVRGELTYGWPTLQPLLNRGLSLCPARPGAGG